MHYDSVEGSSSIVNPMKLHVLESNARPLILGALPCFDMETRGTIILEKLEDV